MKKITLNVSNTIRIKNLPHYYIKKIREPLIIENPKFVENEKHGRSNWKTPRKLRFISEDSKTVPRGFLGQLKKMFVEDKIDYRVRYQVTTKPFLTPIKSNISFADRKYGLKAVEKILKKRAGVLQAPTGSGKTVIGIETITRRNEPTLIVVHTKELLNQWKERLLDFTDLREDQIGMIGDGKKKIGMVTIGIINSLKKMNLDGLFGYIIVDECHRVPSTTFSKFLVKQKPKYLLGLSATPFRNDKLDKVINFFIGNTVHVIDAKKLQEGGHIVKAHLKVIKTEFSPYIDKDKDTGTNYAIVFNKLIKDEFRNQIIIDEVYKQASSDNGIVLIISDRVSHCEYLYSVLGGGVYYNTCIITGATPPKKRKEIIEKLNKGEYKIVIATGQLIGEGFDLKHISSIFLTTPIRWKGRVIQYVGRALRTADGKDKATVFDFNDPCWLLRGSFGVRLKAYKEMGIK